MTPTLSKLKALCAAAQNPHLAAGWEAREELRNEILTFLPALIEVVEAQARVIEAHKLDKAAWVRTVVPGMPMAERLTAKQFDAVGITLADAESALTAALERLEKAI
jgi:hypothetical protein